MKKSKKAIKKAKKAVKKAIFSLITSDDQWHIKINRENNTVNLRRTYKGRMDETYCPLTLQKATVFMTAIIQGYQPPRCLVRLDKPFD